MRDVYTHLCIVAQALRREFEGLRTPLAPATGVASSIYTHQIANVFRVLTDIRVRHLLADEVGLGKTVQALMILNALRYQRTDLRALVVVPDELVAQWRDEILTRAHSVPIGEESEGEGSQYIRLAWEGQLRRSPPAWKLTDIDPNQYHVLVVDELHRLRSDLQQRLVSTAREFEHLLLLTATPAFQEPQRHVQLFTMLEPERSSLAEYTSSEGVVEHLLARDKKNALACTPEKLTLRALAHCAYRRVIRTRRADYKGVLASRKHIPILTEPLGAEAERQSLMWRYFGQLDTISLDIDPIKLAKRVILSPPSLEQRVDFLRRKGHERANLLERVKPLVHKSQGDSRADALVDLLAAIWAIDNSERVLVAAQDNLTVDYLFDIVNARLPQIGPIGRRIPLVATRIRQGMMTEAPEDLGGYGNETIKNLEAFQRGNAQVLFAPETAQVGLNLQCARVLVIYSIPWMPEEVAQWIGRLDRIGNTSAYTQNGEPKDIEIYTIAQKGLVDERVVAVLRCFNAFEHSVNLDGEYLGDVTQLIESSALNSGAANWRQVEHKTQAMAAKNDVKELESDLWPYLPWTKRSALSIREKIDALSPAPLEVLKPDDHDHFMAGPRSWDRTVEDFLRLLQRAGEYTFKWNNDVDHGRFQSLWYRFGNRGIYGKREVLSKVVFSIGADPGAERHPRHAHAFITKRGAISNPPKRHVMIKFEEDDESRRPLHFINFGNPLHDELIESWLDNYPDIFWGIVYLPTEHVFFKQFDVGAYVIRLAVLDPAAWLVTTDVSDQSLRAISKAATRGPVERLVDVMGRFTGIVRRAIEADVRWIRGHITAEFLVQGSRFRKPGWTTASFGELSMLLSPFEHDGHEIPSSKPWTPTDQVRLSVDKAMDELRSEDTRIARKCWSPRFPTLKNALASRLYVIREEARDSVGLAQIESDQAKSNLELAHDHGNQSQITRASNTFDMAADTADMTRVLWTQRIMWLTRCCSAVCNTIPDERVKATLIVRKGPKAGV